MARQIRRRPRRAPASGRRAAAASGVPLKGTIARWIERLSHVRAEFGYQPPCPFAAGCRWAVYRSTGGFWRGFFDGRDMFMSGCFDVLIYAADQDEIEPERVARIRAAFHGFVDDRVAILVSDPRRPMLIDGFRTTQADALLFIFQWRRDLAKARETLRRTRYYLRWSPDDLQRVS